MEREANTITLSYHNKATGQTMEAVYEIGAPDSNEKCQTDMTLSWKDGEGNEITLEDFKEDPYGISGKFINALLGVSDANGGPIQDEDEGGED